MSLNHICNESHSTKLAYYVSVNNRSVITIQTVAIKIEKSLNIEYSWGTSNDSHCIKNRYEIKDD